MPKKINCEEILLTVILEIEEAFSLVHLATLKKCFKLGLTDTQNILYLMYVAKKMFSTFKMYLHFIVQI